MKTLMKTETEVLNGMVMVASQRLSKVRVAIVLRLRIASVNM